jgi:hypothetical protein
MLKFSEALRTTPHLPFAYLLRITFSIVTLEKKWPSSGVRLLNDLSFTPRRVERIFTPTDDFLVAHVSTLVTPLS